MTTWQDLPNDPGSAMAAYAIVYIGVAAMVFAGLCKIYYPHMRFTDPRPMADRPKAQKVDPLTDGMLGALSIAWPISIPVGLVYFIVTRSRRWLTARRQGENKRY
jgi:hypothetical protein